MIECPSCGRRQEPRLICADCGAPLSARLDNFAALELTKKLALDLPGLERTYHDLSRKIHPDRFASAAPAIRESSLRATALLTSAYRTLRDPVARGLYWLELNGESLGRDNKQVPADLAELVFDTQEQLSELRGSRQDGTKSILVVQKRDEIQAAMDQAMAALERNFARIDAAKPDAQKMLILELKAILSKIAYLRTLIRDVDRALEDVKAA
jgi:molecular chaperone HscB